MRLRPGDKKKTMELENISRRELVAVAIVPFAAVRGSAANSAVTVGLTGCGSRGTFDASLMAKIDDARLVALADLFPDRIEQTRKAAGVEGAKGFNSGAELLEKSGVDGVIIATPVFLHPEHFEAAVRAGKNIYIEKPAGADVAGVKRLMTAADSADRKLNITFGFQQRYSPLSRKAKKLAESNGFGPIVMGHSYWVKSGVNRTRQPEPYPKTESDKMKQWHEWRDFFGDYIVENNVHGIDVLNWFLGGHPTKAHGTGGRSVVGYGDNQDHCYVTYDYANNVQGHLIGCMIAPKWYREVKAQFFGDTGVIETRREFWRHYRSNTDVVEEKAPREITIDALEEFIHRIQQRKPENTAATAAESTLTAIMGRMAVDARHEVSWDEMMHSA
jgi:myo-inositol 2-dehydrogenase/D-chiro-inositol 1-dehydrogenase